jgi:hypothetical protein
VSHRFEVLEHHLPNRDQRRDGSVHWRPRAAGSTVLAFTGGAVAPLRNAAPARDDVQRGHGGADRQQRPVPRRRRRGRPDVYVGAAK